MSKMLLLNDWEITKDNIADYQTKLDLIDEAIFPFLKDWWCQENTIEVKTSGSTGQPKTIRHTKDSMIASAQKTLAYFELNEGDSALLCLPSAFIAGKMMLVRAIVGQLKLTAIAPKLTPKWPSKRVKFAAMIPPQVHDLIDNSLPTVMAEKILIGGAPVDDVLRAKMPITTTKFYESYGMTETITHIAVRQLYPVHQPYFEALPGVSFGQDDIGALEIRADHLPETIITNDMVVLDGPKRMNWKGRKDFVVNTGGLKVIVEEWEKIWKKSLKEEVILVGLPHDILGEELCLVTTSDENKLKKICPSIAEQIPRKYLPKKVYFISEFPTLASGKIDRNTCKQEIKVENCLAWSSLE